MLGDILTQVMKPKQTVVTRRLQDALLDSMTESRREQLAHEGMWFRSSGLYKLCPRAIQLAKAHSIDMSMEVGPKLRWIFGSGTAIHTQFQQDYLPSLGNVFQGWWRRIVRTNGEGMEEWARGDELTEGDLPYRWIPRPHGHGWEYEELEFRNTEFRLTGHCDGVLVWDKHDVEALELKTISSRQFDDVNPALGGRPKGEHIIQVQAYMWLMGLNKARIVYINKDLNTLFPDGLCEHLVERDEGQILLIKNMLKSCAEAADNGLDIPLFERMPECTKKSDIRAKDCPSKGECFPRKGK